MRVKVELFSFFRLIAKCKEVEIEIDRESCSFLDVIKELNIRLGEDFVEKIGSKIENKDLQSLVFVNGVNLAQKDGLHTIIPDGSNIRFLPPMGGG
ncbi:MAG: MoaD/ThiS family protein [Tepidanaerobacteraceae bacterium]|jgi:molybdopterin converting factor small subunit